MEDNKFSSVDTTLKQLITSNLTFSDSKMANTWISSMMSYLTKKYCVSFENHTEKEFIIIYFIYSNKKTIHDIHTLNSSSLEFIIHFKIWFDPQISWFV